MTAAITVKDLSYSYEEGPQILHGLSFELPQGSLTAIIGLSGCGKSTLCYALCGVIPQVLGGKLQGDILLNGVDISDIPLALLAKKIGLVMQDPDQQLVTTVVEDELAFAPENLCQKPPTIRKKVTEMLSLLHLEELALRSPNTLSGGQKQLMTLASVLTLDPGILLLDEPMSHLDTLGKQLVQEAMQTLLAGGRTIVMVEHDLSLAAFADLWLVLDQGKVARLDTPQEILADQEFLQRLNLC